MSPEIFTSAGRPAYHKAKLIVKFAREAAVPMTSISAGLGRARAFAAVAEHTGLEVLHRFERAGLIRRAIPLSRKVVLPLAEAGPRRAFATMAASVQPEVAQDANSRVSVIELETDESVAELRAALAADQMVEYVSRVPIRYLCVPRKRASPALRSSAAVPPTSTMWNLSAIKWAEARGQIGFEDATEIKVAVLDTGVDGEHPDLQERVSNYVYAHPLLPNASGPKDYIGHGTHVSGTIAAKIGNVVGINGICSCPLWIWKIFDDEPHYDAFRDRFVYYVDTPMYHRALEDCLDEGIRVVNLSIGGPGEPDPNERSLFDRLLAAGTSVVAAMGNDRQEGSPISYPAAIPGVIAVGATDIGDNVASFSNRGAHISLTAPGDTIWSTLPTYLGQTGFRARHLPDGATMTGEPIGRDMNYAAWSGTSMASPHIAAAAALLLAKTSGLAPALVREKLMGTADRVAAMGAETFHQDYGAGRLNLLRLLA
jgi:hypothetical protein